MLDACGLIALVGTAEPARARAFYAEILGLRLVEEDGFALVFDVEGASLRVSRVADVRPAAYAVLGWRVADILATVRALAGRGVTFCRYAGLEQDELGVWTAPGGARVAWFHDPDGNILSLTQPPTES